MASLGFYPDLLERAGRFSADCRDGLVALAQRFLKLRLALRKLALEPQLAAAFAERARARSARHKPESENQKRNSRNWVLCDPGDEANEEARDVLQCRSNPYRIFRRGGAN